MGKRLNNLDIKYICQQYISGDSSRKIASSLGVDHGTCLRILKNNGIERRGASESKQLYSINEDFFSKIDTEEKAYVLGVIHSDGYVRNTRKDHLLRIVLQSGDENLLHKIRTVLGSNRPLYEHSKKTKTKGVRYYKSLSINNIKIVKDLCDLGYQSPKTLTIRFPNFLEDSLVRHFVRGVVDGDGCLFYSPGSSPSVCITGNHLFINDLEEIFLRFCGVYSGIIQQSISSSRICCNSYLDTLILLDWLYQDSIIYLDRKYYKYLEIKAICNQKLLRNHDKRLKKKLINYVI